MTFCIFENEKSLHIIKIRKLLQSLSESYIFNYIYYKIFHVIFIVQIKRLLYQYILFNLLKLINYLFFFTYLRFNKTEKTDLKIRHIKLPVLIIKLPVGICYLPDDFARIARCDYIVWNILCDYAARADYDIIAYRDA